MVWAMSCPRVHMSSQRARRSTHRAQARARAPSEAACHMVDLPKVPIPQKTKDCSDSADADACNNVTADPTA